MDTTETKRCVIYVRKSVEEGLEQEYNSLDAQTDACKAYIMSQQFNGWRFTGKVYSDGGFSGGNMERPALKELLADLDAGKFDVVALYKIDRLSRSLCDFTNMSKLFESKGASFVSVTQNIDTSNAMGKMILNVLMSFAQFEREVTAERVRDKCIATRMKGIWNGGRVPYGYSLKDKRLVVNERQAGAIRVAFRLFANGLSSNVVADELTRQGYPGVCGGEWTVQKVLKVLDCRYYIGEFPCKGTWVPGQQEGIVDRALWDRVAALREENRPERKAMRRCVDAPLKGIIRCGDCGGAMSPAFTSKGAKRYYYYVCTKDMKRGRARCPIARLSGAQIENVVYEEVGKVLASNNFKSLVAQGDPTRRKAAERALANMPAFWNSLFPLERARILQLLVKEVSVYVDHFHIVINTGGIGQLVNELVGQGAVPCDGGCVMVDVPSWKGRQSGRVTMTKDGWAEGGDDGPRLGLLRALGKGYCYLEMIHQGRVTSSYDLEALGIARRKVAERAMHIVGLSPIIVHKILAGEIREMTVERLLAIKSPLWAEQHAELGI